MDLVPAPGIRTHLWKVSAKIHQSRPDGPLLSLSSHKVEISVCLGFFSPPGTVGPVCVAVGARGPTLLPEVSAPFPSNPESGSRFERAGTPAEPRSLFQTD